MSSEKDNGGPAFPSNDDRLPSYEGMSLRDYFAAQALTALIHAGAEVSIHRPDGILTIPARQGIPMLAYEYADAMLAERSK